MRKTVAFVVAIALSICLVGCREMESAASKEIIDSAGDTVSIAC